MTAIAPTRPARTAGCEPRITNHRNTTVFARSRFLLSALALALALPACGGGDKHRDTYARATDVQGQCCEHLQGAGRDQCLQQVIRIDDPQVAQTSVNQATYACVVDHFTCDPATGRPTPPSAQAQLECIQDLPQ